MTVHEGRCRRCDVFGVWGGNVEVHQYFCWNCRRHMECKRQGKLFV